MQDYQGKILTLALLIVFFVIGNLIVPPSIDRITISTNKSEKNIASIEITPLDRRESTLLSSSMDDQILISTTRNNIENRDVSLNKYSLENGLEWKEELQQMKGNDFLESILGIDSELILLGNSAESISTKPVLLNQNITNFINFSRYFQVYSVNSGKLENTIEIQELIELINPSYQQQFSEYYYEGVIINSQAVFPFYRVDQTLFDENAGLFTYQLRFGLIDIDLQTFEIKIISILEVPLTDTELTIFPGDFQIHDYGNNTVDVSLLLRNQNFPNPDFENYILHRYSYNLVNQRIEEIQLPIVDAECYISCRVKIVDNGQLIKIRTFNVNSANSSASVLYKDKLITLTNLDLIDGEFLIDQAVQLLEFLIVPINFAFNRSASLLVIDLMTNQTAFLPLSSYVEDERFGIEIIHQLDKTTIIITIVDSFIRFNSVLQLEITNRKFAEFLNSFEKMLVSNMIILFPIVTLSSLLLRRKKQKTPVIDTYPVYEETLLE